MSCSISDWSLIFFTKESNSGSTTSLISCRGLWILPAITLHRITYILWTDTDLLDDEQMESMVFPLVEVVCKPHVHHEILYWRRNHASKFDTNHIGLKCKGYKSHLNQGSMQLLYHEISIAHFHQPSILGAHFVTFQL